MVFQLEIYKISNNRYNFVSKQRDDSMAEFDELMKSGDTSRAKIFLASSRESSKDCLCIKNDIENIERILKKDFKITETHLNDIKNNTLNK